MRGTAARKHTSTLNVHPPPSANDVASIDFEFAEIPPSRRSLYFLSPRVPDIDADFMYMLHGLYSAAIGCIIRTM